MATWDRDHSVSQAGSMLFPMAWSPLFWLALAFEGPLEYGSTMGLVFLVLALLVHGFPLFLFSEARPMAQQGARLGMGALAGLFVLVLVGVPVWLIGCGGLIVWVLTARLMHRSFSTPRWRSLVPIEAVNLGPDWRRMEGLGETFECDVNGHHALLSMDQSVAYLYLTGPDKLHLSPVDFGLDDPEEA